MLAWWLAGLLLGLHVAKAHSIQYKELLVTNAKQSIKMPFFPQMSMCIKSGLLTYCCHTGERGGHHQGLLGLVPRPVDLHQDLGQLLGPEQQQHQQQVRGSARRRCSVLLCCYMQGRM